MNEERDQSLARLFESHTAELDGEEFAARIRRRIGRETMIARVHKVILGLVLVGIGGAYSTQIDKAVTDAQASIQQTIDQYVLESILGMALGMAAVVALSIGWLAWRRTRRWN